MARPREFDEGEVLDKAVALFWDRGYDATSLADIEAATGLGRASLYAAFGDKEGLFVKSLERFRRRYDSYADRLASAPSVREGFERVFDMWFETNLHARGPQGCMLQQVATTGTSGIPRAKALVDETMHATEALFRRALERARATGELPEGRSPKLLARFLSVGVQGMSSAARAGLTRRDLEPISKLLLGAVFGDG